MNIKQAIITRNHKAHDNSFFNDCDIDYRGPRKNYERAYTKEQIDYLFFHSLLEKYEPCGAFWEYSGMGEYWQFTNKGRFWRIWYTTPLWLLIKVYVIRVYWFKHKWQKLRIKMGHRYDWQDYVGLDTSDI